MDNSVSTSSALVQSYATLSNTSSRSMDKFVRTCAKNGHLCIIAVMDPSSDEQIAMASPGSLIFMQKVFTEEFFENWRDHIASHGSNDDIDVGPDVNETPSLRIEDIMWATLKHPPPNCPLEVKVFFECMSFQYQYYKSSLMPVFTSGLTLQ